MSRRTAPSSSYLQGRATQVFCALAAFRCLLGAPAFGQGPSIVTKSADYTLTLSDAIVLVDASGAHRTMTLPLLSGAATQEYAYIIKKVDDSRRAVIIEQHATDESGGKLIDGRSYLVLTDRGESVTLRSDGTKWEILGQKASRIAIDIRDLGCIEGDPSFDNAAVLNAYFAQLAHQKADARLALYVPGGSWALRTTLVIPLSLSVRINGNGLVDARGPASSEGWLGRASRFVWYAEDKTQDMVSYQGLGLVLDGIMFQGYDGGDCYDENARA